MSGLHRGWRSWLGLPGRGNGLRATSRGRHEWSLDLSHSGRQVSRAQRRVVVGSVAAAHICGSACGRCGLVSRSRRHWRFWSGLSSWGSIQWTGRVPRLRHWLHGGQSQGVQDRAVWWLSGTVGSVVAWLVVGQRRRRRRWTARRTARSGQFTRSDASCRKWNTAVVSSLVLVGNTLIQRTVRARKMWWWWRW
jgi:hypothetical protein